MIICYYMFMDVEILTRWLTVAGIFQIAFVVEVFFLGVEAVAVPLSPITGMTIYTFRYTSFQVSLWAQWHLLETQLGSVQSSENKLIPAKRESLDNAMSPF